MTDPGEAWDEHAQTEAFVYSIFLAELASICVQGKFAVDELEAGLREKRGARIWFAVQSTLVLAADASRLLWGNGAEAARDSLRKAAEVGDDSILRQRRVRNALEHIDERIITWAHAGGSQFMQRRVEWGKGPFSPPAGSKIRSLRAGDVGRVLPGPG